MLQYKLDKKDGHLDVIFQGDLDIDGTEIFHQEIIPLVSKFTKVNINLSQVPFVDSSGMGLLIELVRSTEGIKTRVFISDVRDEVFEVFKLLQIPEILGEGTFVKNKAI